MIGKQTGVGGVLTPWKGVLVTAVVALFAGGAGGYFFGFDAGQDQASSSPKEGFAYPEELAAAHEELQTRMADFRVRSDEVLKRQAELGVVASGEELALLRERLDSMPTAAELSSRSDFLANPRVNEPRTPSGVSTRVLDSYQRSSGLSPQAVEELMQKGRE